MSYESRLIAPFYKGSGLDKYFKPWLIGDDAFEEAENMFTWRGSIRKRDGYQLLARLPAHESINAISNANPAVVTTSGAHNFAMGSVYHVWLEGITDGDYTDLNNRLFRATRTGVSTFSLQDLYGNNIDKSGAGAPAGAVGSVYLPVQSLVSRIIPNTKDQQLIAFDQVRAWLFNTSTSAFNDISFFNGGGAITWTGGNNDYFWSCNFGDSMWATNFVDPIRFYNGTAASGWNNQRLQINSTPDYVHRALIILPYKSRLVILNTFEGALGAPPGTQFAQRARWSQIGTPYVPATGGDPAITLPITFAGATDVNAWRDDIPGRGGYTDAPTNETIVSAEIVNDNLIVFFQRSTWRLRYTGNQVLPFVWEEINSHLGSECTYGTTGYDSVAYSVSRYGYIGADTNNVQRIDQKIPDNAFEIETGDVNEELNRVACTRDFFRDFIYWAYPSSDTNARTNDRVLALNHDEQTWTPFTMNVRCFGQYKAFNDRTWANMTTPWESEGTPWGLGQDNFVEVVAGQDDGRVQIVFSPNSSTTDNGTNFNFDLRTKRLNPYIGNGGKCRLQYFDLYTTGSAAGQITVEHYINGNDTTPVQTVTVDLVSTENAKYTRVFLGSSAEFHQLRFFFSDDQLADADIGAALIEIQGMVWWTRQDARIRAGAFL